MNTGLTLKMRLTEWIRPWFSHDSLAELDFGGVAEVAFSPQGYAVNPMPGKANHSALLSAVQDPEALSLPKHKNIIISIDTGLCFRRIVEFPARSKATLAEALRLDLLRVTPFNPVEIITAHRILGSEKGENTRQVEQLVCKRQALEPLKRVLTARKKKLEAIIIRDGRSGLWPIALTGDGQPYGIDRHRRWFKSVAASFLAIAIAGGIGALAAEWQTSDQSRAVSEKIAALKPEADKILVRVEVLKASSAALQDLGAWKQNSLRLQNLIEELSQLLPDDAFLESLTQDGTAVVLEGQAARPEDLISRLEASSLLAKVAFAAPVYRNPAETQSHFSIRLEVVEGNSGHETVAKTPP